MRKFIAISAAFFTFVVVARAQDTSPPTVTMTAPVNGVEITTDRVTVTGNATDNTGVKVVQYRIEGSSRWRKATLTNPDAASTAYVFSYKNTKKGRARRIYIRSLDAAGNESDTLGRKIRRSRSDIAPAAAAPAAGPGNGFPNL